MLKNKNKLRLSLTEREGEALTITCLYCINKFYLYAQCWTRSVLVLFPKMLNEQKEEKKDKKNKKKVSTLTRSCRSSLRSNTLYLFSVFTRIAVGYNRCLHCAEFAFPLYSRAHIRKKSIVRARGDYDRR